VFNIIICPDFYQIFVYMFILGGTVWQVLEYQSRRYKLWIMARLQREPGQVVSGDMVDVQNDVTAWYKVLVQESPSFEEVAGKENVSYTFAAWR